MAEKKTIKITMASPCKNTLLSKNKCSWFSQEQTNDEEANVSLDNEVEIGPVSASYRKLYSWQNNDELQSSSEDDEQSKDNSLEQNNSSLNYWVIDMEILQSYLQINAVCKECNSELYLTELSQYRTGLGTKFVLKCKSNICKSHSANDGFYTTKKERTNV